MTTGYTGNPSPEISNLLLPAILTESELPRGFVTQEVSGVSFMLTESLQKKKHTKCGFCVCFISPYRHSEEMIKKLESAGLGFYVRATETQQKLGIYDDCVLLPLVSVQ